MHCFSQHSQAMLRTSFNEPDEDTFSEDKIKSQNLLYKKDKNVLHGFFTKWINVVTRTKKLFYTGKRNKVERYIVW